MVRKSIEYKIPNDYYVMFCICIIIATAGLLWDTPQNIFHGLYKINVSRSVLITDYVELAGIGATLVNSAILFLFNLLLLVLSKSKPKGRTIAALFLTVGFSLFGKNLFNTLPIVGGVWLYGRVAKTRFANLTILAMIGTTIAPIVSEIAFLNEYTNFPKILIAYAVGIIVGFIFPLVIESVKSKHNNFCLYKGGIAGGFIATMSAGILRSLGVEIVPENYWNTEQAHSLYLSALAFTIAAGLIIYGIIAEKPALAFQKLKKLINEKDQNDCDYFIKYGKTSYINIGIMCIMATALMLSLGIPVNGPVLGGIFTIAGFGAHGKHLKNTIPILIGSIIAATYFNHIESTAPLNTLAILFSTGLAPIAGKYGWHWGILTGFVHVSIAIFIGDINGGLNLYNNGFAGCFVVVTVLPIIVASSRFFAKVKNKVKDVIVEHDNPQKEISPNS